MTKGLFGKNQKINADNINPGFLALIPLSTENKHRNCLMTTGNGLLNDIDNFQGMELQLSLVSLII